MNFQSESWFHVKPDFDVLGKMNFEECKISELPYSLDHVFFDWAADNDMVHVTTAREDGKLVGYILSIITPRHIQYEAKCSQQIGMYLHPDYRVKGLHGLKLMQEDEVNLRKKGVQRMYGGFTVAKDLGPLFKRRGWKKAEEHYTKWIAN